MLLSTLYLFKGKLRIETKHISSPEFSDMLKPIGLSHACLYKASVTFLDSDHIYTRHVPHSSTLQLRSNNELLHTQHHLEAMQGH